MSNSHTSVTISLAYRNLNDTCFLLTDPLKMYINAQYPQRPRLTCFAGGDVAHRFLGDLLPVGVGGHLGHRLRTVAVLGDGSFGLGPVVVVD